MCSVLGYLLLPPPSPSLPPSLSLPPPSLSLPLSPFFSPSPLSTHVHNFYSCCNSTVTGDVLSSCSNPLYNYLNGINQPSRTQFCPTPPKLSYSAASASQQPSGPLESENVYIAEVLLRVARDLTPDVFFRRFQAGFSLTSREPPHSVCGCTQPDSVCDSPYISALNTGVPSGSGGGNDTQIPRYFFNQNCADFWGFFALDRNCNFSLNIINSIPGCSNLSFPMADSRLECNSSIAMEESYQVDGFSSNLLKVCTMATHMQWSVYYTIMCYMYCHAIAVWSMWKSQHLLQ